MQVPVPWWKSSISIPFCLCLLVLVLDSSASAELVDFEDGVGHDIVIPGDHYAGLTLTNAVWISIGGSNFHDGTFGLGVDAGVVGVNNWAFPGTSSPILIEFDTPVSSVSIDVFDVGDRGARLTAFDSSGLPIGSDSFSTDGGPVDVTLAFSDSDIRRIELSQLVESTSNGDGIGWDNLSFSSPTLLGDVNLDGAVNLLDVNFFIDRVANGNFQVEADCNEDGAVDLLDIDPFIAILSGG